LRHVVALRHPRRSAPPLTATACPYTPLFRSNGTFLNGARISEGLATKNDVVTFGKVAFRVKQVSAPKGDLAERDDVVFGGEPFRSEEHTSELQSLRHLVCRLLLEKKKRLTNN